LDVQAWPPPVQLLVWHVPLAAPGGMAQENPVQQSAVLVQTEPCGWHAVGARHFPESTPPSVPTQRCEQQSLPRVHAVSLPWQTPASGVVPASGVPASPGGGGITWQASVPVSVARQLVPAQHSLELVQVDPTGVQLATVQYSFPFGPGTHGAPPQHWSLNWHSCPVAMQQPACPVYPVGHWADAPPKQRGMPELSSLQTSLPALKSLQQFCEALMLPPSGRTGAPQMFPVGLQLWPLSQRPPAQVTVPLGLVPPPQQLWLSVHQVPVRRQPSAGSQTFTPEPGSMQIREQQVEPPLLQISPAWSQPPPPDPLTLAQRPTPPSLLAVQA